MKVLLKNFFEEIFPRGRRMIDIHLLISSFIIDISGNLSNKHLYSPVAGRVTGHFRQPASPALQLCRSVALRFILVMIVSTCVRSVLS